MRWTRKQITDYANCICERGYASDAAWDTLPDYEIVIHDVCVTIWWMFGWPEFGHFFESGFDAEQISEAFDEIGHPMAATTVRYANAIYRVSPDHDDLETLGRALYAMRESVYHRLSFYLNAHYINR